MHRLGAKVRFLIFCQMALSFVSDRSYTTLAQVSPESTPWDGQVAWGFGRPKTESKHQSEGVPQAYFSPGRVGLGSWFEISLCVLCLFVCSRVGRERLTPMATLMATHPDPPGDPFWFGISLFVRLFVCRGVPGWVASHPP